MSSVNNSNNLFYPREDLSVKHSVLPAPETRLREQSLQREIEIRTLVGIHAYDGCPMSFSRLVQSRWALGYIPNATQIARDAAQLYSVYVPIDDNLLPARMFTAPAASSNRSRFSPWRCKRSSETTNVENPRKSPRIFTKLSGFHDFLFSPRILRTGTRFFLRSVTSRSYARSSSLGLAISKLQQSRNDILVELRPSETNRGTSTNVCSRKMGLDVLCLVLCYVLSGNLATADETDNRIRPYEFSFNIVDFQHRYEKKDADGIITGEYGFITADGVYHETGYATDKNGDFIITRMKNRRITSLKDALEIFKDKPEAARKLVEAVAQACSSCKIQVKHRKMNGTELTAPTIATSSKTKVGPELKETTKTENKNTGEAISKNKSLQGTNKVPEDTKDSFNARKGKSLLEKIVNTMDTGKKLLRKNEVDPNPKINDSVLGKMTSDLYYRFNYTITSHDHQEDGYRSGKKDGSYRVQSENGVDTRVKYLSNEFGHQPNISFVPRANGTTENQSLKGYSFLWRNLINFNLGVESI
ncbi:uncharacterized protein LOC143154878 [Ptiloglossa arizonensis]|uniref:uncharacterized protein LOC143154878 n=1 Tax=Ptiloglossa arizonensis TaxID=3350558 RepID=UPI003F9FA6E5